MNCFEGLSLDTKDASLFDAARAAIAAGHPPDTLIPVSYFHGLRDNTPTMDQVGNPYRPTCWCAAHFNPAEPGGGPSYDIFDLANISPDAWKTYLREEHGFDLATPTAAYFERQRMDRRFVEPALNLAKEFADGWEEGAYIDWPHDPDERTVLEPAQVYAMIDEARGAGLVHVFFQIPLGDLAAVGPSDLLVVEAGQDSAGYVINLYDPINGQSGGDVTSREPLTIFGHQGRLVHNRAYLDDFGIAADAYVVRSGLPEATATARP